MQLGFRGTDQESACDQDDDTTSGLDWLGVKSGNLMPDLGEWKGLQDLLITDCGNALHIITYSKLADDVGGSSNNGRLKSEHRILALSEGG